MAIELVIPACIALFYSMIDAEKCIFKIGVVCQYFFRVIPWQCTSSDSSPLQYCYRDYGRKASGTQTTQELSVSSVMKITFEMMYGYRRYTGVYLYLLCLIVNHQWLFKIPTVKEKLTADPDSEIATTSLRVSLLCPVCWLFLL